MTASPEEHVELFQALRSGGGDALAVVTELQIDLYPVDEVYAGNLVYPVADAGAFTAGFAEWTRQLPDEIAVR